MPERAPPRQMLFTAGLAAILASACCVGPLVLLGLGVSGVWIGNLTALEPYRPLFIGVAAIALLLAWRRIWRPAAKCKPGGVCATPRVRRGYQVLFSLVVAMVLIALLSPYVAPLFY